MCHSDGQDGNKTIFGSSVDDDAASLLNELIARVVWSAGLCPRCILWIWELVLKGTPWLQHSFSTLILLLNLEVAETWDDTVVHYL